RSTTVELRRMEDLKKTICNWRFVICNLVNQNLNLSGPIGFQITNHKLPITNHPTLAANSRSAPLPAAPARSLWHRPCRTPHSPPPESPPRRAPPPPLSPSQRRHLLRCGIGSLAPRESPPTSSFCAASPG